ncbi:Bifunctional cytochrome P450/NADPH--P450 reductase [Fusarium oxysporum f. sp. albedinis]|nr:Bifunctional cytochrome P450/NADPH--P450 reductase [Fusarium oxysporum f. sp. albedinis]
MNINVTTHGVFKIDRQCCVHISVDENGTNWPLNMTIRVSSRTYSTYPTLTSITNHKEFSVARSSFLIHSTFPYIWKTLGGTPVFASCLPALSGDIGC